MLRQGEGDKGELAAPLGKSQSESIPVKRSNEIHIYQASGMLPSFLLDPLNEANYEGDDDDDDDDNDHARCCAIYCAGLLPSRVTTTAGTK